ncbi:hypothetical protein B0H10DRAFT_2310278, partial [Mycena sp. CBHHK59/15]
SGLGKASIVALARKNPAHIYFSGRDADRASALIAEVTTEMPTARLTCEMSSLSSVVQATKELAATAEHLDILMCNAGVFSVPPALTTASDGYELHFGVNHVAHALFMKLLLPTLLRSTDARIVILTSRAFQGPPSGGIQFDKLRTTLSGIPARFLRYGQSKLANLVYTAEVARRYPQITSVSVHPGIANTDMFKSMRRIEQFIVYLIERGQVKTPEDVALTQLWAATVEKDKLVNGEYYEPVGVIGKRTELSKRR